ncbi:hypothetical protein Ql52_gp009 [Caulobacter phage Quill_5.2]|uniref:Uncharacterized protein n=1 Tax=Caulobacter phage Quill_5.2 TaxID=3075108 RepID=A0AA96Q0Y4_9CAUD|nr:hypothetical protein Ql52_gp009 [Caulobacter phage Quill_5.2]
MSFYTVVEPGTYAYNKWYADNGHEHMAKVIEDQFSDLSSGSFADALYHSRWAAYCAAEKMAKAWNDEVDSYQLAYIGHWRSVKIMDPMVLVCDSMNAKVRYEIRALHKRHTILPIHTAPWFDHHWFNEAVRVGCPEVDKEKRGNVLVYANVADMLRLKRTSMKAGRWIAMVGRGHISKRDVEWVARAFTLDEAPLPPGYENLRFGLAEGEQAAIDVYAGDVYSCMQKDDEVAQWGTGDFRVAYCYDEDDKLIARAVVSLKVMKWMTIYGGTTPARTCLEQWLIKQGFKAVGYGQSDGWGGSRCRLVSWQGMWKTPYIDRGSVYYDHNTFECVFDPEDYDGLKQDWPKAEEYICTVPDLRPVAGPPTPYWVKYVLAAEAKAEAADQRLVSSQEMERYYQQRYREANDQNLSLSAQLNEVRRELDNALYGARGYTPREIDRNAPTVRVEVETQRGVWSMFTIPRRLWDRCGRQRRYPLRDFAPLRSQAERMGIDLMSGRESLTERVEADYLSPTVRTTYTRPNLQQLTREVGNTLSAAAARNMADTLMRQYTAMDARLAQAMVTGTRTPLAYIDDVA